MGFHEVFAVTEMYIFQIKSVLDTSSDLFLLVFVIVTAKIDSNDILGEETNTKTKNSRQLAYIKHR